VTQPEGAPLLGPGRHSRGRRPPTQPRGGRWSPGVEFTVRYLAQPVQIGANCRTRTPPLPFRTSH